MRLVWWVGALASGVSIAFAVRPDAATSQGLRPLVLLAAGISWLLVRTRHHAWAEGVMACAIGIYVGARALQAPILPAPVAAVVDVDRKVVVDGYVEWGPEAQVGSGGSRLRILIERVDGTAARATASVAVATGFPPVLPGDVVRFAAALRSVRGLANPGVPDSALAVRATGVEVLAGVGTSAAIQRLPDGQIGLAPSVAGWLIVLRLAGRARRALGRAIDAGAGSGPVAAFLHTAVLGERSVTDPGVEDGFRAAGATHLLSVSGLHLAAIAAGFFMGVRWLLAAVPRLPLWVDPRGTAAVLAVPAVGFYAVLTGGAIATARSALMMGFGLVGIALGRRNTPLVAIAAAVLVLLGRSPLVMWDVSFQLSVLSVLAMAIVVPRLTPDRGAAAASTRVGSRWGRWARVPLAWLGGFAAATFAASITTAPVVAHHFGEVTPAAPLGNLLLVPLVELVVVPFGILGAVVGAVVQAAVAGGPRALWGTTCSLPFLGLASWAAEAALRIAELFRTHAPVWLTRSPNGLEAVTLSVGFASALACVRRPRAGSSPRRPAAAVAVAFIVVGVGSITGRELSRRWSRDLVITFLDVGQGDAAVVQIPGGRTMLIDGGGTYDGSFDPGARVVEPFLRSRGITHLEVVALSHPHPDHMGGLHRILARFSADRLWTSGDDGRNPDYFRLLGEARQRGVAIPIPERWEVNGAALEPLGPFVVDAGLGGLEHIGAPEGTSVNDASLILRASFGGRAVLFTGDIEADGEGELAGRIALGQTVACDVLKVPHHGSRTSSSTELLDAARPRIAIMSLGWHNRFHFPRAEVVERYRSRGIRLFRTDLEGAVSVTIRLDGSLEATCARACR